MESCDFLDSEFDQSERSTANKRNDSNSSAQNQDKKPSKRSSDIILKKNMLRSQVKKALESLVYVPSDAPANKGLASVESSKSKKLKKSDSSMNKPSTSSNTRKRILSAFKSSEDSNDNELEANPKKSRLSDQEEFEPLVEEEEEEEYIEESLQSSSENDNEPLRITANKKSNSDKPSTPQKKERNDVPVEVVIETIANNIRMQAAICQGSNWWERLPPFDIVIKKYGHTEATRDKSDKHRGPTFSVEEMKLMLTYLIQKNMLKDGVKARTWKACHRDGYMVHRSVESLRNNFKRCIVPKYEMFRLPKEENLILKDIHDRLHNNKK